MHLTMKYYAQIRNGVIENTLKYEEGFAVINTDVDLTIVTTGSIDKLREISIFLGVTDLSAIDMLK